MEFANQGYRPKHESLKIEEIELGRCYAITLNPKLQPPLTKPNYTAFIKKQWEHLREHSECMQMELFPESSPLGRIHFHGIVRIEEHLQWITNIRLLMEDYTVCVKPMFPENTLVGSEAWLAYCSKQEHIWAPLFIDNIMTYPLQIVATGNIPESNKQTRLTDKDKRGYNLLIKGGFRGNPRESSRGVGAPRAP